MLSQGQYFNPIVPLYLFPRGEDFTPYRMYERYDEGRQLMTQHWPYGEMGMAMQNPYWIINRNMFNNDRDRYMANAGLKYKVFDWMYALTMPTPDIQKNFMPAQMPNLLKAKDIMATVRT